MKLWTILIPTIAVSLCTPKVYTTKCSSSNTKSMVLFQCDSEEPQIITIDCDFHCQAGTYLSPFPEPKCLACPPGSYSLGGGTIFGSSSSPWSNKTLSHFLNTCSTTSELTQARLLNCTGWVVSENILSSSEALIGYVYKSSLSFTIKIIKPGFFHLRYRKDCYKINGLVTGILDLSINNVIILEDINLGQNDWRIFKVPLGLGLNIITVSYHVQADENHPDPRAFISIIEVLGDKTADLDCFSCLGGMEKAPECDVCGENEYKENHICFECPKDTYSFKGSVGNLSCVKREACEESDFTVRYGDCEKGARKVWKEWIQPVICDSSRYELGNNTEQPCEVCKNGQDESGNCSLCEDFKYLDQGECKSCKSGYFLNMMDNVTSWSPLPKDFSTYCLDSGGWTCIPQVGWMAHKNYLTTGLFLHKGTRKYLKKTVKIIHHSGKVLINYELALFESKLQIFVNNQLIHTLKKATIKSYSFLLPEGLHEISFVYSSSSDALDEGKIFFIEIWGSDQGIGVNCELCPEGHISSLGQTCKTCPAGTESDISRTNCVKCGSDQYSKEDGQSCISCPAGTEPSKSQTYCEGVDILKNEKDFYYIKNIIGKEGSSSKICESNSSKIFCQHSFYGPLQAEEKSFYVSVISPAELSLPSGSYLEQRDIGYAFGVFLYNESRYSNSSDCGGKKVVVNIGRELKGINFTDNGILIKYTYGDFCQVGKRFESTLRILCDKETGTGWPVYEDRNDCEFIFSWRSKYGCRLCAYDELITLNGECINGNKTFQMIENSNCIVPNEVKWTIKCSKLEELLYSWEMGVIILGFVFLVLAGIISTIFFVKYNKGYEQLKAESLPSSRND